MNVARLLYIGADRLKYPEKEIFGMTLRKFYLIFDEYLEANNLKKKDELDLDAFF